ncbi:MAG TPA: potassium-transporting ATPase subunit KdpA [Candidatus Borkfalkia excrementavium]|uniref:Potassium-transporting ATPase subunit KdpA n=1 Tax=Candidatus Borkfalkia excrementavium TaxID=2838505 RepID=A0A9D2CEK1_9FIRM|nr:potassium-transporting ATPase subunit KdpA [Candidatus Borkfalkia excrementavium]
MPRKIRLTPVRLLVLGYLAVILIGTLLLIIPFASKIPGSASFMDAFFTTVSASCVTGLVVQDTFTHWSLFGQIVILMLIQIGGIGFMTVVFLLLRLGKRKIGLKERTFMQESVSAPNLSGMGRLTTTILLGTLLFEGVGAFILCFRFIPDFGWGLGIWMAIFTAVSAFCNAGFDLMGADGVPFASVTRYSGDPIICLTIPLLIIIGGLGFFVWQDIKSNRFHFRKYELHTKLVLIMTAILVLLPTGIIMIAEDDLPWKERILSSFFTAVTPRTAGFNVLPLSGVGSVKSVTIFLTIVLMFIGGSSGSTAGGIKTNTLAILGLSVFSLVRGKRSVECFGRRIDETNVKNAAQFVTVFMTLIVVGTILLCLFEEHNPAFAEEPVSVTAALFEVVSAIATVGLTTGITPSLTLGSQIVLCILMFLGRAGCMTVMLSWKTPSAPAAELPMEKVRIG